MVSWSNKLYCSFQLAFGESLILPFLWKGTFCPSLRFWSWEPPRMIWPHMLAQLIYDIDNWFYEIFVQFFSFFGHPLDFLNNLILYTQTSPFYHQRMLFRGLYYKCPWNAPPQTESVILESLQSTVKQQWNFWNVFIFQQNSTFALMCAVSLYLLE